MVDKEKTIMIMAGGTGGHVFPALSVAQELSGNGVKIVWLGTQKGIESRLVPDAGYEIEYITVSGLVGSGVKRKLTAPFMLLLAVWQAFKIIRKHKPSCLLGMGGFASGPGGVAAKLLGKPIIIHEQNAFAGLTNRKLAGMAKTVLTGFRSCEGLPADSIWVGNPVRQSINSMSEDGQNKNRSKGEILNVLILGGSQGASSLNQYLPAALAQCINGLKVRVLHQAGKGNSQQVRDSYKSQSGFESVLIEEFIDEMDVAYRWAHIVICRAGAMTIAELMAMGKPSVLVPYPHAAGDHQTKNAKVMVHTDAAIMVKDSGIKSNDFIQEVSKLMRSKERLEQMSENARKLHRPKAAKQVASFCEEYIDA